MPLCSFPDWQADGVKVCFACMHSTSCDFFLPSVKCPTLSHSPSTRWAPSRLPGRWSLAWAGCHWGPVSAAWSCRSASRLGQSSAGCSWSPAGAGCGGGLAGMYAGCCQTGPGSPSRASSWRRRGAAWRLSACCSWGWARSVCKAVPGRCGRFRKSSCGAAWGSWPGGGGPWGPAPAGCCTCGGCVAFLNPNVKKNMTWTVSTSLLWPYWAHGILHIAKNV